MAVAKKKDDSKELAQAGNAGLPTLKNEDPAWGSEALSNSDILVPKLLVMQGLSELVANGEASVGQIRDSINGELMGGMLKPKEQPKSMEVIAFSAFKTWVVFEKRNGKDEYVKTVPIVPENEHWAINEIVGGVEVRRDKCLNFYVLRPEEIKAGMAFPYVISFRRTSSYAGKKLATIAAKLKAFKQPLASKVIDLNVAPEENDKGKYFVYTLEAGRNSTEAEQATCRKWWETLQAKIATIRVDDSDLKKETAGPAAQRSASENMDY